MRYFAIFSFLLCALLACDCNAQERNRPCEIQTFGTNPALSVLLEILAPETMIGLNYKPYPEDREFMPKNVANLPVLGHLGDGSLSFESLIALKPRLVLFDVSVPDSVLKPYQQLGIATLKISSYEDSHYDEAIKALMQALESDRVCGARIKDRALKLLKFSQRARKRLEELRAGLKAERVRVYFAQGFDGLKTECARRASDLAALMGAENIFVCEQGQIQVDMERLATRNPQAIFVREIGLYQNLMSSPPPLWAHLDAIKNKRIYYAPSTPSNWLMRPPSVMRSIGLLWGFSKLYPHALSEDEVKALAKEFFATFLQPLNDEAYTRLQGAK